MAYTPHTLLELIGTLDSLSGRAEDFVMTLRVMQENAPGTPLPEDEIEGWLDAFVDGAHGMPEDIKTVWADATFGMWTGAKLKAVKLNRIGADGKYSTPGITHVRDFTPVAGGAAQQAPAFLSLAWTYETAKVRGRAHRGRCYPPNPTLTFTGSQISDAFRDANAARGARFLNTVQHAVVDDAGSNRVYPVICSHLDGSFNTVTAVTSDNIYDVQRRRKEQLVGSRSAPVPAYTP